MLLLKIKVRVEITLMLNAYEQLHTQHWAVMQVFVS